MTSDGDRREDDPTLMRNQPALQTSTGAIWLGLGTLLTIIVLAVLVPLMSIHTVIAAVGAAFVVILYGALVVTRFVSAPGRSRLTVMASLFGGIALVGLVTVFVVSSVQAASPGGS
ncbi:hypothetical protein [Mycetocola zhadangensis]|uniref:Uncharacterized protein n=1 Tax=Mycetocola zhadangensis TaxID=1164595 RepID=A0A3L7J5M7_9MICO|nr:hypothetical protein [Mycetocola zhadangensis]RLQ85769.1 hypothetical protein D9V28_02605 [Mycetocola zhadangensis]GGE85657.1 hypothetical protein GCM10011313_05140 [Mycetocola zhadangensis]